MPLKCLGQWIVPEEGSSALNRGRCEAQATAPGLGSGSGMMAGKIFSKGVMWVWISHINRVEIDALGIHDRLEMCKAACAHGLVAQASLSEQGL